MPTEIGLWRVDDKPVKVNTSMMPLEATLEDLLEADVSLLGDPLLLIGRQVPTAYGTFIDLLGIDVDGAVHLLELKRDKTPREVVAQALDYGSWAQTLTNDAIRDLYANYRPGHEFDADFAERFGASPPEDLNAAHSLTVIAGALDAATERIVNYLAGYDVPINVAFFRYYEDDGRHYLARTWLIDEATGPSSSGTNAKKTKEPWNGQDWYVAFGEVNDSRSWDDAARYGFVSAGGGEWFSRTLRAVPIGARVNVHLPGLGYVGVGTIIGEAMPYRDAVLSIDGVEHKMSELPLKGSYIHPREGSDAEDRAEYVLPVDWTVVVERGDAVWKQGMFANQNSACKLRNRFTLEEIAKRFRLDEA